MNSIFCSAASPNTLLSLFCVHKREHLRTVAIFSKKRMVLVVYTSIWAQSHPPIANLLAPHVTKSSFICQYLTEPSSQFHYGYLISFITYMEFLLLSSTCWFYSSKFTSKCHWYWRYESLIHFLVTCTFLRSWLDVMLTPNMTRS